VVGLLTKNFVIIKFKVQPILIGAGEGIERVYLTNSLMLALPSCWPKADIMCLKSYVTEILIRKKGDKRWRWSWRGDPSKKDAKMVADSWKEDSLSNYISYKSPYHTSKHTHLEGEAIF
jgi:hypothetical protein